MQNTQVNEIVSLFGVESGHSPELAILDIPPDQNLVVTVDTLVADVHFLPNTPASQIGHKALAVNLSDLAAMGSQPVWISISLVLPEFDKVWLQAFRDGLMRLARQFNVEVIAVSAVTGPLAITIQAYGLVPPGRTLLRSGAKPGDNIIVSGCLGDAGLALHYLTSGEHIPDDYCEYLLQRLHCPQPQIALGLALQGIASSAIDISDGLTADLGHILEQSNVGACIEAGQLPVSEAMHALVSVESAQQYASGSGDDYELCFTVPSANVKKLEQVSRNLGINCSRIGVIVKQAGLRVLSANGSVKEIEATGYDHFRENINTDT